MMASLGMINVARCTPYKMDINELIAGTRQTDINFCIGIGAIRDLQPKH